MHNDDNTNRTAKSHNVLDADGRHSKGLRVAERLMLNTDIRALWISPEGEIWRIETKQGEAGVCRVTMPFTAIGSGKQYAMGAMAQGAPALIAVAVACKFDLYSREPIHIVALQPTLDEICVTT